MQEYFLKLAEKFPKPTSILFQYLQNVQLQIALWKSRSAGAAVVASDVFV